MFHTLLCCGLTLTLASAPCRAQVPPSPPPASSQPASKTPILDAYKDLWSKVRGDKLVLTAFMYPDRTRLELDPSAPANAKEDLVAYLKAMQPHIQQLIELTKKTPEPFPPDPAMDQRKPDAHMDHPRAWMQNFTRLLHADAVRQWESGDAAAATQRLAAMFRIGTLMQNQKSELVQNTGLGILGRSIRQSAKLADAGLMSKLKPKAAAEFRTAVASVKPVKRVTGAPDLSDDIERDLRDLRTKIGS